MKSLRRPITRLSFARPALTLAVASLGFLIPSDGSTRPVTAGEGLVGGAAVVAAPADQNDAVAGLRPETRLRKLHLVRPDLIPYPIAYEVYC